MQRQRQVADARLSASKRFGRYKTEQEKAVRKSDVKEDEVLESLKEAWKRFHFKQTEPHTTYSKAFEQVRDLVYSTKDVEKFSVFLEELQDEDVFSDKAGYFLSALINNGSDDDYTIHTSHLSRPIHFLGFRNKKNVLVEGDLGDYAFTRMERGNFTVNGDACDRAGHRMNSGEVLIRKNAGYRLGDKMFGGRITLEGNGGSDVGGQMSEGTILVKGDVGRGLGREMHGGRIWVEGNADEFVGGTAKDSPYHVNMQGGEIHIEGDIESLGNVDHGRIYHKGKLIVDK